jgi:hypothetical protein
MDQEERQRVLREAIGDAVTERSKTEAEARNARLKGSRRRNSAVAWAAFVLGLAGLGYIWTARPAWVFDPLAPAEMSPAQAEATTRFSLFLERARVDDFRDRRGRLPTSLPEAGPVEDGIDYQRIGGGYLLTGASNGVQLRLTDAMDADSFLGNSLRVLRPAH